MNLPLRPETNRLSAQAALDLLVHSALDWPGKTLRLEPDSAESYLQRPASPAQSIAELYHANSRLSAASIGRLLVTRLDVTAFRNLAVEGSATASPGAAPGDPAPPRWLMSLLCATRDAAGSDLFYALDLRLVHANVVYAFEPLSARAPVLKLLHAADAQAIVHAARLLTPENGASKAPAGMGDGGEPDALVLVVGRFGRHDIIYGPRGYRRTLIEAGRLTQEVLRLAGDRGIGASLVTEFADEELDAAAIADGVEDGCLAVIELQEVCDDST